MLKNIQWLLIIVLGMFSLFINTMFAADPVGQSANKPYHVMIHSKEAEKSILSQYVYPWIPLLSVVMVAPIGAFIGHYYWLKREDYFKKSKIFDEKINCYSNFSKQILRHSVCTAIMIEKDNEIKDLENKSEKKEEIIQRTLELRKEHSECRIIMLDALGEMKQEFNKTKVFFDSEDYKNNEKIFDEFMAKKKNEDESDEDFLGNVIELGKNLASSMGEEVKKDLEQSKTILRRFM